MADESKQIIEGCKKGDLRAQECLYKNYYRAMMIICMRYTKSNNDAVETLNNAFLKVFDNISKYDPLKGTLYTWIRTIVIHSCLDRIREKKRIDSTVELHEDVGVNVESDAMSRMNVQEILSWIRDLAPATAAVFNLCVMEGYSHKEIAQLLNISENTSRWHLNQARSQLRLKIKNHSDHS